MFIGALFYMKIIGKKIISYKEIDSTNDEAKRLIKKGLGEGAVVVARAQTKGRGKPGSSWFSPAGLGIYLSVIVKPFKDPKELAPITLLGAQAVVKTIGGLTKLTAQIKQPNDVLLNGKKISGILVERLASGYLIIGIGFNINQTADSWPAELGDQATSLKIETGKEFNLPEVAALLLDELDQLYLAYLK